MTPPRQVRLRVIALLTSLGYLSFALLPPSAHALSLTPTTSTLPTGATTTSFVYDGDGGRVKLTTSSGTTKFLGASYEIGPDGTTTKYVFAGSQRMLAKDSTGAVRYYHGDHLGSSSVITNATGALVELAEYTPYGSLSRREGSTNVPQKYTGKRLDPTGLYFYEARYYDPLIGRFITPDTLVPNPHNPQDLNRYTYAGNNPLKYTDPTGHKKRHHFWKKFGSSLLQAVGVLAAPFTAGQSMWLAAAGTAWGGVQAAQAGQFGSWAAGFIVSAGLGLALPTPNFSNFLLQVGAGALRGAAIGAVSGGVASLAGGGSFGGGAMAGAMGGASGGALSAFATSQQTTNAIQSHGFHSNEGVIKNLYTQGKFQEAIDFTANRYGITNVQGLAKYDPNLPADTAGVTGGRYPSSVEYLNIGPEAFTRPESGLGPFDVSRLPGTLFHEGVHVDQFTSGRFWGMTPSATEAEAYGSTLQNANRLHLSPDVKSYYQFRYYQEK